MSEPRRPVLFVDRDGTLIEEPADCQVDRFEKLRFVPGVIPALASLCAAGWELVMVTNQDGLGTPAFPRADFDGPHALMLQVFASQGVTFRDVRIDASRPEDASPDRKPGIGLVLDYRSDPAVDWRRSAMVGDRESDLGFARNLGVRGFRIGAPRPGGVWDWPAIARELVDAPRAACLRRITRETAIEAEIDLDHAAPPRVRTGLGFFDHLLEQLGTHGGFALRLDCAGDLHVDEHHTVEDSALALGGALRAALGDKRGVARYGFTLPMDEALARAALDLAGRPHFAFHGRFTRERVGDLPTELVPHFFRSLSDAAGMNLHLAMRGDNAHHQAEACFKVVARALGRAVRRRGSDLPTTKGTL